MIFRPKNNIKAVNVFHIITKAFVGCYLMPNNGYKFELDRQSLKYT